jgi:hypothetical protein
MPGDPVKKPKPTAPARSRQPSSDRPAAEPPLAAKDHYEREKARRARNAPPDSEAMASAHREYQALLEMNAAKGRGGRPKKQPAPPRAAEDSLEEVGADDE